MTNYLMSGGHTNWEVMWLVKKNGQRVIFSKDFDNDLTGAIDLYSKAKRAGKPFTTLRCKNVAFPPPKKYQPHIKVEKKKVRRNGKIFIEKKQVEIIPMVIVNHRGLTWCPYCREFRKFQKQDGRRFEGIFVPQVGYYCMMCGISSEDGMVLRHNPNAPRVTRQIRRSNGRTPRRTRKR